MKTLTVVAPAFNEVEGIEEFCRVLTAELSRISSYDTYILLVIDGGADGTFEVARRIAERDRSVQVLKLSRNFGHQSALLAGIDHAANSDLIVTMDSDLQHPPALIPRLIEEYEKGFDIVHTVREHNEQETGVRHFLGTAFYRLLNMLSDTPIRENAADFRLLSGRVARVIRDGVRERAVFLRGIVSWIGFRQAYVPFSAHKRIAGSSKYSFRRLLRFALFGIISFSKKPLRAASVVGMLFASFGFLFAIWTTIEYYRGVALPPGWATVVVLLSLFSGAQLIFLGILGEYIGAIFDEAKARPHYIIEEAVNLSPDSLTG